MLNTNPSDQSSRRRVAQSPILEAFLSNSSRETEDFQKKVAEQIAEICSDESVGDGFQGANDVDLPDHMVREIDAFQLLTVEPPLTLSKICSRLTAVEQLWLVRIVKAYGKEVVLARWPAYEANINYVRRLR